MAFEAADSPWLLPALGLFVGIILGAAARWNHFCTLSSLERHWYAADTSGLRTWGLAIAVALLTTQLLNAANLIDLSQSFYLRPKLSLIGAIGGGILFGLGMALVGTCGFGALVRLGSGSLRSLIVVAVIGLSALMAQRGVVGQYRQSIIEPLNIGFTGESQSIASIMQQALGLSHSPSLAIAILIFCGLVFWVFRDREYRSNTKAIITGSIIGLCVTAGWAITSYLSTIMYRQVQVESASFALPPGETIFSLIAITGNVPDYGMGMVLGVVAGSALVAKLTKDVHWEACDDPRELARHLTGAFLMGTGGILAAGCTIGQGISAFSTMALSAPVVIISIAVGARLGLSLLLEGRPKFLQIDTK